MDFDYSSGYSPRVCRRCRQLKRKCDKVLPKCHPCAKGHFKCSYLDQQESYPQPGLISPADSPVAVSDNTLRPPVLQPERIVSSDFPSIYFLDYQLYQRSIAEIPKITTAIPSDLHALTEGIRERAKVYFRRVHPWLPFLSKKLFNERLLSPLIPRGIDVALLLACVNLISSIPDGENTRTREYLIIKSAILEAEVAGVLSIRVFQAWILLCVYEIGHGIYPSAYVSIGACAKYGSALGLSRHNTGRPEQTVNWIEAEERIRAWWAIVILDRFSNLGCPGRSLSTEDPVNDTKLPMDDTSWDQGVRGGYHVCTISSPASPLMGRFALMAQAASLLGRVYHHLSDSKDDTAFSNEEATILERALTALTVVANEEGSSRGIGVCTPTILCHSARILLAIQAQGDDPSLEDLDHDPGNRIINGGIAHDVVRLCQWAASETGQQLDEEISPFPLNATYHTGVVYLNLYYKEHNPEYLERLCELKGLMAICTPRWKVAGVYLQMLEAREAMYMNSLL